MWTQNASTDLDGFKDQNPQQVRGLMPGKNQHSICLLYNCLH